MWRGQGASPRYTAAPEAGRELTFSSAARAAGGADNISDREVLDRYVVSGMNGERFGCLPLLFDQKYEDVVAQVSQMVPCPGPRLEGHGASSYPVLMNAWPRSDRDLRC
jgi:hypothetical protein